MARSTLQYALSMREYELLHDFLVKRSPDAVRKRSALASKPSSEHDYNPAAFRSAVRVFLATATGLKSWELISERLLSRGKPKRTVAKVAYIKSPSFRLALSLASILYLHRILFRFFLRLRSRLLSEKATQLRKRYPRLFKGMTSNLAPAIGASLAGLALGIYPKDQLRVTMAIYTGARSLEFLYSAFEGDGYFKNMPWWFGSWMLFPLSQGQLLHAFVFDRDCFPVAYGDFILKYTPQYIQRRPDNVPAALVWPTYPQIVDSLAEMARLRWPPFISPILRPSNNAPLPPTINSVISPITSRAHPAIQHLSCALIHPSDPSCFSAYLSHNVAAFPQLARFFAMYYGAFSLLGYKKLFSSPLEFFNNLAARVLRTTASISGAIGASWGSICLFAMILPRNLWPKSRFFLGGLLAGCFQFLDRTSSGRTNALYAARTSADSLWKVGVKHGWWRGIKGGDVWVFVAGLAVLNVVYEAREGAVDSGAAKGMMKVLRGEADIGISGSNEGDEKEKGL